MPELPEVETICRALKPCLSGKKILRVETHVPRLRSPLDENGLNNSLAGKRVTAVRRRAKYIIVETDGGSGALIHLGMTGTLAIHQSSSQLDKHDRAVLKLEGAVELRLHDPRRFGLLERFALESPGQDPACLAGLGPEPLSTDFSGTYLFDETRGRKRPIKQLLLEQDFVAGVGNIYDCEALFRSRISPKRQACRLTQKECDTLAGEIKAVLKESIKRGGTTLNDYRKLDGSEGAYALRLLVYGREGEPCPTCGKPVARFAQGGRSTFWCGHCQR